MLPLKISYKKLRALLIVISSSAAAAVTTAAATVTTMSLSKVNYTAAAAVDKTGQHGQTLLAKVVLSDDKELKVFDDCVFIHSVSKPEKRIHLTFNR